MLRRHTEHNNRIMLLDSGQTDLVADGEAQRARVGLDGVGLEIQHCTSPASRLQRPGGSERDFVGEITALLHGCFLAPFSGPWRMRLPRKK